MNLLDERSKSLTDDMRNKFSKIRKELVDEVSHALKKAKLETTIAERKEEEEKPKITPAEAPDEKKEKPKDVKK
jgi:hypothetical protein